MEAKRGGLHSRKVLNSRGVGGNSALKVEVGHVFIEFSRMVAQVNTYRRVSLHDWSHRAVPPMVLVLSLSKVHTGTLKGLG